MTGPGKVPDANGQMRPRPNEERQLERDHEAHEHARDGEQLSKAAARAQAKGTMR